ncbi:helix-turn-helix domain-containing protein (plasmid) [Deinococcus radiomollis]|uniref:helix-turn-helix domain-containing protein n=1 Tax=Deinococcus radiomollis TaxID=468916 RepID=UPI00389268E6
MDTLTITTKKKGFFQIENDFYDLGFLGQITGTATKVYLALSRYANNATGISFPSIMLLATKLKMDRKTVMRAIQELIDFNFIKKIKQGGRDAGSNHYEIQDLPDVKLHEKPKKQINPPQKKIAAKKKENDFIPETNSDLYNAYLDLISENGEALEVQAWSEETLMKKIGKNNLEYVEACYKYLANSWRVKPATMKVYLLSPKDMITQLYPIIKPKMISAKQEKEELDGQEQEEKMIKEAEQIANDLKMMTKIVEDGVLSSEDIQEYKELSKISDRNEMEDKRYQEILSVAIEYQNRIINDSIIHLGVVYQFGKFKIAQ